MADTPNPFAPGTPAFIVAVDDQPSTILVKDAAGKDQRLDNFGRWVSRGVNTLFRSQKDEPIEQWVERGAAAGFKLIPTVPFLSDGSVRSTLIQWLEGNYPNVIIGWTFEDEADRRQAIRPNPPITYERMRSIRDQVRAVTSKPIYLTFTGGGGGFDNKDYKGDAAGQWSHGGPGHKAPDGWFGLPDVVCWDYHLWASGRPGLFDIHDRMQDRAWEWSGHKPQMIYVESSPQNLENKGRPGPTAAEYVDLIRRRVQRAKDKGQDLKGIIIFPQKIGGGWMADNTPDDVAAVMPATHRALTGEQPAPAPAPAPPADAEVIAQLRRDLADSEKRTADALTQVDALTRQLGDERQARKAVEQLHADFVGVMGRMGLRVRGD